MTLSRRSVLGMGAVALLAGCGNGSTGASATHSTSGSTPRPLSQLPVTADPRTLTGPSTAKLADRSVQRVTSTEKQQLPTKVVSHFRDGDRTFTVTDTSRIVAFDLSGSIAATLWALGLGDRLVARDVSTNFPGTEELPLITSEGHSVNAEAILSHRPTLIITDGTMGPRDVVEQLADTGVPVIFVTNTASYAGAATLAQEVGAAVGLPQSGKALGARITTEVAGARQALQRFVPRSATERLRTVFLYIRGNSDVYYLFGDDNGVGDLIDGLGGVDVSRQLGWQELQPLTDEAMVAAKPDVILVMTDGLASAGGVNGLLSSKPAVALTPAGKHRRIVDMADGDVLSFGPRSAAVLEALGRAVYAPGAA